MARLEPGFTGHTSTTRRSSQSILNKEGSWTHLSRLMLRIKLISLLISVRRFKEGPILSFIKNTVSWVCLS